MSLALHAAVLAWLARRSTPPPPRPANVPVQLVFLGPRPAPKPASPPSAMSAKPPSPKPAGPSRHAPSRPRSAEPSPSSPPIATVPDGKAHSGAALPSDAPRADGMGRFPGQTGPGPRVDDLSLLSQMPSVSTPDAHGGAIVSDPKAVVDSTVSQAVGIQRAAGSVPFYFHDLRLALQAAWDVNRIIQRKRRDGLMPRPTRTLVRLVQDREGHLLHLAVIAASRDPEVDTAVLLDLQRVARSLPVPTPDALGSRERLVTVWQLDFIPPPPGVEIKTSGGFDIMNLVDKHAIPPPSTKILKLLSYE